MQACRMLDSCKNKQLCKVYNTHSGWPTFSYAQLLTERFSTSTSELQGPRLNYWLRFVIVPTILENKVHLKEVKFYSPAQ